MVRKEAYALVVVAIKQSIKQCLLFCTVKSLLGIIRLISTYNQRPMQVLFAELAFCHLGRTDDRPSSTRLQRERFGDNELLGKLQIEKFGQWLLLGSLGMGMAVIYGT